MFQAHRKADELLSVDCEGLVVVVEDKGAQQAVKDKVRNWRTDLAALKQRQNQAQQVAEQKMADRFFHKI